MPYDIGDSKRDPNLENYPYRVWTEDVEFAVPRTAACLGILRSVPIVSSVVPLFGLTSQMVGLLYYSYELG